MALVGQEAQEVSYIIGYKESPERHQRPVPKLKVRRLEGFVLFCFTSAEA